MGIFFSSDITTLNGLFNHGLKSIYYAERQNAEALEQMIAMASDSELRSAFEQHLTETQNQRVRLERIFGIVGIEAEEGSCPAIDGIIADAKAVAGEIDDDSVLDAALAFGAQQVEHHEIAVYGTLAAWASELGKDDVASILEETLAEERSTDQRLTRIAEARVNVAKGGQESRTRDRDAAISAKSPMQTA